jgi:hypothetical protein
MYRSDRWEREARERLDRDLTKLGTSMMDPWQKKSTKLREADHARRAEEAKAKAAREYEEKKLASVTAALNDPYPLIARAFRKIEASERGGIEKWAAKFLDAPSYELSWMQDGVVQAAIRYELAGSLAARFEEGKDPMPTPTDPGAQRLLTESVRDWLVEAARHEAKSLQRSTSVTSNWVEDNKRVVYNEWADEKSWSSDVPKIEDDEKMLYCAMFRFFDAVKLYRTGQEEAAVALLMKW